MGAVEQPHDAFDNRERRSGRERSRQRFRPHCPAIEIDAGTAGGGGMEGGIDIVRANLGAGDIDALAPERPEQAERDRGLAAARGRRRDDQAL